MLQRARYIVGPDYYTLHATRVCHVAHAERASRLSTGITSTVLANDNSTCHHLPSRVVIRPFLSQQLETHRSLHGRRRLFRGTAHDKPRYRAAATAAFRIVKAPPERPRRVVVVTSASINGTLDVTRRPNFPDKPASRYVCAAS